MSKKEYVKKLSKTKQVLTKEFKEPQSKVERIPIELLHEFKRIGNGNWKQGMTAALISHNTHDPKELLMKDCDGLMHHLELFYDNNHNSHFNNCCQEKEYLHWNRRSLSYEHIRCYRGLCFHC